MKVLKFVAATLIAALLISGNTGCLKDKCTNKMSYTSYTPVYLTPDQIRAGVEVQAPKCMGSSGKIWYYDHYMLVNEPQLGIHVFDNANPSSPVQLCFIAIPGNVDLAVNQGYLYADNYLDLLVFNLASPSAPVLVERLQGVFESNYYLYPDLGYIVEYNEEVVEVEQDCNSGGVFFEDIINFGGGGVMINNDFAGSNASAAAAAVPSVGGSMARFTLANDRLYTINQGALDIFNTTAAASPVKTGTTYVGWNIETLFPQGNNLFMGSTSGMYIYDISAPDAPQYVSVFEHASACDPVFIQGNRAYVTLRNGTTCQNFNNQLDVLDITNLSSPTLIKTYPMQNPHGLSVVGNKLFICEGDHGVKFLDCTDPNNVTVLSQTTGLNAYDAIAIPGTNTLIVSGRNGIYEFDHTDMSNPTELSSIPICN